VRDKHQVERNKRGDTVDAQLQQLWWTLSMFTSLWTLVSPSLTCDSAYSL
jgi:hypothetical protein